MKVLKDNYTESNINIKAEQTKPYPRKHICESCASELEYEKSDVYIGVYGAAYLDCPLCGYDNMLEDHEDTITLTLDNIEFPIHFHHASIEDGAVDTCDNKHVKEFVQRAIKSFRKDKDEDDWVRYTMSGNTMIFVFKLDGDECYEVYVGENYYNTYIPFEGCDY